jgi:hypothetical protein
MILGSESQETGDHILLSGSSGSLQTLNCRLGWYPRYMASAWRTWKNRFQELLYCWVMGRALLTRERVWVAVETCLLAAAYKWTSFLGVLFRLSAVVSQYVWPSFGVPPPKSTVPRAQWCRSQWVYTVAAGNQIASQRLCTCSKIRHTLSLAESAFSESIYVKSYWLAKTVSEYNYILNNSRELGVPRGSQPTVWQITA